MSQKCYVGVMGVFLFSFLVACGGGGGGSSSGDDVNPPATKALNVALIDVLKQKCSEGIIQLLVSVVDENGSPRLGLPPEAFTITENGVPNTISTMEHPITSPVSVSLVLDYSGSLTIDEQTKMQEAAKSFVDQMGEFDEAQVIKFALEWYDYSGGFSSDKAALKNAIDASYDYYTGGTILYKTLVDAIDGLKARENNVRSVVVLSDGYDEESDELDPPVAYEDVVASSVQNHIPIHTLTYLDAAHPQELLMEKLAFDTGGLPFVSPTADDLLAVYSDVADALTNQYILQYETAYTNGENIQIVVRATDGEIQGEDSVQTEGCQAL